MYCRTATLTNIVHYIIWTDDNNNPITKTDYIEQYKLLYEFIPLY